MTVEAAKRRGWEFQTVRALGRRTHRGYEVSFHHIPVELWKSLPGVVTGHFGSKRKGFSAKRLLRGKRSVTFFSDKRVKP